MLEQILSRIDLLGIPIILNFSRSKKVRSSFGGSWSLAFLGFLLWALYNSGNELWAKKKPTINQGVTFNPDLTPLEMTSETIPLMVSMAIHPVILSESEWENSWSMEPDYATYVQITNDQISVAMQTTCNYTYLLLESASSDGMSGTWLDMEPCTKEHFAEFDGIIDSNTENLIPSSYCLPIKSYGLVYGFSLSINCATTYFFSSVNPTVELYYPKYGLSLQNYTYPIQPYLYNYRKPILSEGTTYSYWNLNHLDITTDQGWLTTSDKTDRYAQVSQPVNPDYTSNNQRVENVLIFKLSKEEVFYTRTYAKIQNVLADVGGLAGSVLAGLLVLMTPFARVKLSETFVNEMFDLRTEYDPKARDRKQQNKKSKKNPKGTKSVKDGSKSSFDGDARKQDNLQTLEMAERSVKDPSKRIIPVKSQNYEIPGDASPLVNSGRIVADAQPSKAEGITILQNVKKSFSECEEISTPVRMPVQTIKPNHLTGGFGLKHPFSGAQHKTTEIEVQDLENPEISPELPPIETPLKFENGGEKEQMGAKGYIETQQDYGRNASEVLIEDQSRKLRKDGAFDARQLTLSSKGKKIKPKFINITFLEYLSSFVYQSESTKAKIKIINQGLDMLDSRLDVFNIMKKMRDIDKVKGLIFDKDQMFLFDRLSRPDIWNPSTHWYQENYLSYYEVFKKVNEMEELEMNARIGESKRALENKPEKSEVDERILGLI